jgi:co-chaperonin GroES (HSP10)
MTTETGKCPEDLEVLGHRILIRPQFDVETIEEGALEGFVMDVGDDFKRGKAGAHRGEIISIGPNAWLAYDGGEHWAEVGDIVYFAKHGGKFITHEDEILIIVNDEDVQLRITKREDDG